MSLFSQIRNVVSERRRGDLSVQELSPTVSERHTDADPDPRAHECIQDFDHYYRVLAEYDPRALEEASAAWKLALESGYTNYVGSLRRTLERLLNNQLVHEDGDRLVDVEAELLRSDEYFADALDWVEDDTRELIAKMSPEQARLIVADRFARRLKTVEIGEVLAADMDADSGVDVEFDAGAVDGAEWDRRIREEIELQLRERAALTIVHQDVQAARARHIKPAVGAEHDRAPQINASVRSEANQSGRTVSP